MSNVPIEKLLAAALCVPLGDPDSKYCQWGLPVMLWGPPGIGKSDRVNAASAMVGLPPRTVYAATTQPESVSGAAFPHTTKLVGMLEAGIEGAIEALEDPEGFGGGLTGELAKRVFGKAVPSVLKRALLKARAYGAASVAIEPLIPGIADLMIDGCGTLFLDEIANARPAVQGAYLGVVLTRRLGDRQLPGRVRVLAAGNPVDSAAGGWELEPPMANRFCHFEVACPTTEEWRTWLRNEGGAKFSPIEDAEERVIRNWGDGWADAVGQFDGFMHTQSQSTLYKLPADGHKDRGRAWPSPRTWHMATRAAATCYCLELDSTVRDAFIAGCVGEAGAVAFAAWALNADLPKVSDMLAHGWTPDTKRLDRSIAAYTALTSHVLGRKTMAEKIAIAPGAWRCIRQSMEAGMLDITLPAAQILVRGGLDTKVSPDVATEARPVLSRLAKEGYGAYLGTSA